MLVELVNQSYITRSTGSTLRIPFHAALEWRATRMEMGLSSFSYYIRGFPCNFFFPFSYLYIHLYLVRVV